ncbi:MAG: NUDIX domain-containing protein [Proteobacteria bacterium]|nr:NUDIX domain-containing protein [Pseudomonadota bacterium]
MKNTRLRPDPRVELVGRRTLFEGFFRIEEYRLRHRLHDGGWSPELRREIFERGHAVGVLLFDPGRDGVVLVEQFRVGALAAGWDPWLIEIAAGIIEEGESPEEVVRREAKEETGCEVGDLIHLQDYLASPGGSSETVGLYLGRVDAGRAGGVHGVRAEHEDIRVRVLPFAEAVAMLDAGRLDNAAAIIAVGWLARHHDEVRARWRAG